MTRYVTRSAKPLYVETPLWSQDTESHRPSLSVSDHKSRFTGLLDANGEEIWKAPRGIGFNAEL